MRLTAQAFGVACQHISAASKALRLYDVLVPSIACSFRLRSMEDRMLTNWIPQDSLAALDDGFVVAIMLEAKGGRVRGSR
jgi:hypothetical protein